MSETSTPKTAGAGTAAAWIGVLSSLVTVGLTVWNAQTSARIDEAKLSIEAEKTRIAELETQLRHAEAQSRLALDKAAQSVARFEFVHELFPSLMETDGIRRSLTINLVRLLLSPEEATALFEGFSASEREEVRSLGVQGVSTLDAVARERNDRIRRLVEAINSDVRSERLAAVAALVDQFSDSSTTVVETLDWLGPDRIDSLTSSGRINALYLLSSTGAKAWSPELLEEARRAIERMEQRDAQGVAAIGPQTRESIQVLESRLEEIARGR